MPIILRLSWNRVLLLALCLQCCLGSAKATTVIIPGDEDLIIGARLIVTGKVISISSGSLDDDGAIYTYVTLEVAEVFKGDATAGVIVLKEAGGEVGSRGEIVYGAPQFSTGEDVFLYLDTGPDGSLRVHQMYLGKLSIVKDQKAARSIVVRGRGAGSVELPTSAASDPVIDRMQFEDYAEMVREKIKATAERARQFEAIHYGERPILMRPPDYAMKMMGRDLHPQFATFNPASCWFEVAGGQQIAFLTNTAEAPYQQVLDDISAALNVWSTAPGTSLRLASGGTTSQCLPAVGRNLITFNNCDGQWSPSPSCSGVLARAGSRYDTTKSRTVNGRTYFRMIYSYVSINPYASCHFTSRCNLREVITHELGHAVGLAHAGDIAAGFPTGTEMDATMYPIVHLDGRGASVRGDDVAGIGFIYPARAPAVGPVITTGAPLASCILGSDYLQTLSAVGGAPSYAWSLAEGMGDLPPGITLRPDGRLSGKVTALGSFSFMAQVTDTLSQKAQKAISITVTEGPRIKRVKYKKSKMQLIVKGEGFDPSSTLLVDKKQVAMSAGEVGSFKIKPLELSVGPHEIRVVNSRGVWSDPLSLRVE